MANEQDSRQWALSAAIQASCINSELARALNASDLSVYRSHLRSAIKVLREAEDSLIRADMAAVP